MRSWCLALLLLAASPASAQSVRTGIEAWQKGDVGTAVAIWKPLAAKGDADAQFNLAQAYKLGRGVAVDLAQAKVFFERAARQGHTDAQTNLGLLLFQNGDREEALRWLKTAADAGEPRAMLVYGTALFNGDGVSRDTITAYAMVSRAAAQGLDPAKSTLGEMDQVLPLADRQAGVAMALRWAKPPAPAKSPSKTPVARTVAAATLKTSPPASKLPPPNVATASNAGWRIQLGAFSQRGAAEALFERLRAGLPGKQPLFVPSGAMTRLQAGPFQSRAEASAACKGLMAKGQACFPVPGR